MINFLTTILLILTLLLFCKFNVEQDKSEKSKDSASIDTKHKGSDTINNVIFYKCDKDSTTVLPF